MTEDTQARLAALKERAEYLLSPANDDTPEPIDGFPNSSDVIRGLLARLAAVEQEKAQLQKELAECYRLTGADPDGNEDWILAGHAVEEVRRLRDEHDAIEDQLDLAEVKLSLVEQAIQQIDLKQVRMVITAAYIGSAEHGSFFRGSRGEMCPNAFLVLEDLEDQLKALRSASPQGEL